MIIIWPFWAIHGAVLLPNIEIRPDGLLTPAVKIFFDPG